MVLRFMGEAGWGERERGREEGKADEKGLDLFGDSQLDKLDFYEH